MQKYCYHCMRPLDASPVCRYCGSTNRNRLAAAPYHLAPGTLLSNRYLIGTALGEGGFGITYIGLDTTLSKRVAVKEFFPSGAANRADPVSGSVTVVPGKEELFNSGVERFLFEAKSVAAFSDEDGIVDVLDYFRANNTAYIVMEYLEGETLKEYVNRHGIFRADTLVSLMLPVMRSLRLMHARGVIHRDISPDNIMYTKSGRLKLMDFGSARYYTIEDRQMAVMLKQGFAPVEQYSRDSRQGPFTDVYALCATIYACITGSVPQSSIDRMTNDGLIPPTRRGVIVSPAQEHAIMHGLAIYPQYRTQNMDALIAEFTADINRPPEPKQPVPPPEPPKKKNGALIAAIVISIVAVLAVGGVLTFIILSSQKSGDSQPAQPATAQAQTIAPLTENPAVEPAEETTEEEPTEPPAEPTEKPTEAPETEPAESVPSKEEIDAKVSVIADNFNKTIAYMDRQKIVGDYAVAETDDGYLWISYPKDEMKDSDDPKTWYFFNSSGELYFMFEITSYTQYRYYVDGDEIIRYTVGKPGHQTVYDKGDNHITEELNRKIDKAYEALGAVKE